MATKKTTRSRTAGTASDSSRTSSTIDEMFLAALERGDDSFETGRMIATFKEGANDDTMKSFAAAQGLRVADARDFDEQAVVMEDLADADVVNFPEIGAALISGTAAQERGLSAAAEITDAGIASIDPEYFVFIEGAGDEFLRDLVVGGTIENPGDYLRGFVRAAETIANDLRGAMTPGVPTPSPSGEEALVSGATWGLQACRVPQSTRSGAGIRIAILDTGLDLGHPDFAGRAIAGRSFVGQPVADLHSHGTHCAGTAAGPKAPSGTTPRYGIAYRSQIFAGKVLSNSGKSVGASVLGGMNWAIAQRCHVISLSLGGPSPAQPSYTNAGQSALNNGLLMIAAAGNSNSFTGAPANSPTIMSVANINSNFTRWPSSNFGKVDIGGPGVNVFSSIPRPRRYGYKTGTSMACPHVAGCAALWAETSPSLRGLNLWTRLRQTAKPLPLPPSQGGAGLVQAPA